MLTVLEVVRKTSGYLSTHGVESARLEAELLVGHVLNLPRMRLYLEFERPVGEPELAILRELMRRRGRREPLQYVIGHTDFHGLRLKTDRRALIPRQETELLVELVGERLPVPPAKILDLGTGSGALALAFAARFPEARVTATDSSEDALALAAENAASHSLESRVGFARANWFEGLNGQGPFDLIVSNPPYLSLEEAAASAPEVREHEPASALSAAEDGYADLGIILREARSWLAPGGLLALETGTGHHGRLGEAALSGGYSRTESLRDLAGRDRFFLAWP